MSSLRNALRCIFFALVFTAPLSAYAANYDVRVFFDTDSNRATGCTIPTPNGPVAGVEQVLTTSVTVNGGVGTVTGVTRQLCVNGLFFGDPVPVNGGWNVGVSPTGNLFIETHVGANVMTMTNIGTMRLAFTVTSGGLTDAMTTDFGDDILYPVRPSRRRAVSTGALRTIRLDGIDTDWAGVDTLASGDAASPALRFLDASAYADLSDLFFNFRIQTNVNAPTALDDFYALGTIGGTLSVSTLGVLNNDSDPNHLSLTAFVVEGPEHGTLTLNANGGFTYAHDGSHFFEDHFRYRVTNGTLESNLATVTISLPGSHPYTFTSADHVTFTAGQLNTFHVIVTGNPTPALTEDGVLPSGITFTDNGDGTGTLSGTPAAGTVGTYPIVFHAEKNKPHQTDQNFTLTVVCSAITVTVPIVHMGTINTFFSQTFTQSGGAAPITWSESGALPAGITFNPSTGVLSGTPTQGGTFSIVVTATDASGCTGSAPYTLTIVCNSITVTNPNTTSGTVNVAFSQTFTQAGGVGTTTFSLASGTLPAGLTLNPSTGVLSGTPTQKGSFPIVVRATDSHGCAGDGPTFPLNIGCQVISVTNPATNTGTVNVAFSQTFTSGNGIAPVVFSVNSGTLPAGITLNSSTGVLSGTPTQTGSFPITIKATDANGCFGIGATYTLTISCQIITVNNPGTNSGTVNVAFSQTFTAGNAIAPVTFSINSGSLPAGITLNPATGVLSGTPTQTGSFPITIKATDANGCFGIGATYTLTIGCQVITVNNPGTNSGTVNAAFSQTFTAGNTIGAVTFTLNSGTLPTGLSLSSGGVLSGTPTQTGSFPITVKATDANGCTGIGATYTLTINCQVITVTNPATTTGVAGTPFSQTFTQTGGFGATTFSTASTLPTGLSLSSGGVLSGTPTQTGTFPIVVTATDANGCTGSGATYTLVIACQTITVTNPLTTTGTAGTAFSQTFTQSGAIGASTFTINSGSLPTGLSLSAGGVLSGTPTQTGSFPITVKVTDGNGCTGIGATYTLVIGCQTITVTNPATTTGTAGAAFSQTFTQTSAIGGATFSLNSGSLPAGLSLSAAGVLSGTPTVTGSFPITVKVTDGNGCTGVGSTYTLVIGCQTITVTNPVTTTGTIQVAFSQTFSQSGAIGGATFSINSGTLPAGLTLSSAGVLSGTPTVTGSFPITVKVTDGNGCTGVSAGYNLVINCQTITVTNPATTTGTVSAPFTQTFTQSGANGTATFTTASTLPAGLSLATDGTLSGTPTQPGTFPIVVTVTDSNGCTGTGPTYTLIISCQTITVTNPATSSGPAGTPFSQTFTEIGGIGTITWSESGALPTGLTFHTATGILDGTPTQGGTFPITVTATDSNGCFGTGATYNLTIICPTITVTNPATTTGTVGVAFSQTFTQSGGIGTITFSKSGALPTGLTFHTATGVLDGTPTQAGSFPITVTATDSNGCTGTGPIYTLVTSCPTITVTNPATTTGTVGVAFSQTFTQSGGIGTITFSETGTLPTGLTFHAATGVLDGTPSQFGTFPITVKATDSSGCFGTGSTYNLVISCPTITVTNPATTTGTVDTPFSQTFTQTGAFGTATFTTSSTLPPGLTLSTAGVLSGTPGAPGLFPIVVVVTDTAGCTGTNSSTPYNLNIGCQTITVTKPVVTTGTVDTPFSQTFTQSGVGTHTPATFTLASGSLPSGLSLSAAGVLSGTPGQQGLFPITVKATDVNGCFGTSTTYNLNIACQTITVTNPATTTGTVAVAFSQTFTQSGVGTHTPANFSTASTLPTGFSLSTAGVLSGTTNQHGTFPIVVTVTDANGCTGTGATYNLVINCQTITVTNPGVNTGTVGTPFSQQFTETGALGGSTFSTASTLPNGLSLDSAGLLSGTPLQSGSFPIVVTVTDGNGCTGTGATYTLTIACNVITVTNPGVTTGTVDAAFSQTFTQSGGNGTITWSKTGAIPAGMTFHTATGVLDGTPGAPGGFPITVTATDSNGCQGTGATYTLVIACQTITVNNPGVTTGTVDAPFSQTFTQSGVGTHTPATFVINSGSLPSGLSLSTAGVLSGTPGQPGSFPITVKVTDANGCTGISATYTLVIACQTITVTNPLTTSGVFNTAFSQTFTQSGVGTHTPATFTINSGTLPTGLSLSAAGVLSGTPSQTGTFPITVKVTDANGCTGIGPTYNLAITPSLGPDTYSNLVDNTQAVVTGGATASPGTPFVTLTGSVLANDLPAGGVTVSPTGAFATSAGGSVTIASDGTFIYTPKANPSGAVTTLDTFTYTGSSNTGGTATPTTATATVTLNLANRVWYVKNNGGGTNGQSQSPFTTLAAAAGASTANDIIFVYNGDGTNSGQNAGIALKNGQQLLGEVNGLIVNAQTLVAVGSRPTIGNSGGAGVTVAASTANGDRTGIFIKGLSIAGTTNAVDISSANAQTLTATVDNVNITAATANNGVKVGAAGTLTSTVTVQNSTINSAGQNGIDAQQTTAGNLVLNINNNAIVATGTGINVVGTGSTSTTITNFASNAISGNTGGSGITITTATFDATPGGAFQTVSGGTTTIGSAGNGVGAAGLVLTNVAGDLSFTNLAIVSSNGAGLSASGTTPYTGSAGFQIAVAAGASTIDATNGPAADLNTVTANLPWSTIKSANSVSTGVSLVTVPGTFTAGAGSSISNATSTDFNISGSNATVTYDGTITDASGRAVSIASTTGGTKSFTGAITNNGGTGISLTNNTGATINFSGTIILSTGGSDAFTATGGGTVSASDTSSTITTTTGAAINVANTNIGASNLKFKSVTAGTGASGPANAIILNTTGASGGLIISGTGSAGSGGTIQKTTSNSIQLTSTKNVDLSFMNIQNSSAGAISGTGVNGFSLTSCSITGNVGGINDGQTAAVILTDTTNAVSFVSDTVTGTTGVNGFNVELHASAASSAAITTLTVTGGSYSNSAQNGGFLIDAKNTSKVGAAFFSGVTFNNNFSKGLQMAQNDNSVLGDSATAPLAGWGGPPNGSITVTGCTFVGNNVAAELDGGTGAAGAAGSTYYRFVNNGTALNPIVGIPITTPGTGSSHCLVFANGSDSGGGSYKAFISGNFLGSATQVASGKGNGMRIFMQGQQSSTVTVVNNSVLNCPIGRGIEVSELGRPGGGFGQTQLNIKLTGNTVNPMDSTGFPLYAIYVGADAQGTGTSGSSVAAEIHGNTVPTPANGACDTQCTGTPATAMIAYETVSGATGTHTGTLFQTGPGGSVSADIAATNTGTAGKNCAYVNGGTLTLVGVAPPTVN
ncbi:MAG TPA: putative Ig domain-containing protein [Thermoanaerobaculia bacterium]|nr:putative Ig domain-containing protein [Thermoanaerobaculia bacterium]